MYKLDYHKPKSLGEAGDLLSSHDNSTLMAGGMSLLPTLKLRLAQYDHLVDLAAIPDIKGIKRDGNFLTIGAMTRHYDVASSDVVARAIPALTVLAGGIGDPMVRNRGTIGGSIANADPAADYPAAVLGLGANIVTNRREIAGDDFFLGLFETALGASEIIMAVRFPIPLAAGYVKLHHPASRFALVGVFVARTKGGVRVAVTGAGPCVFRLKDAEALLDREFSAGALANLAVKPDGLNSDMHATAEYRAHAIPVLLARAVDAAKAASGAVAGERK
ncbi:MAG: FAD binding domain-containing protein [Pseudolabrys sp.]